MAITEAYAGSTAIGTATGEYSLTADSTALATATDDGVYQAWLDLNALEKACIVEFKTYEKVTSSATQRVVYSVPLRQCPDRAQLGEPEPCPPARLGDDAQDRGRDRPADHPVEHPQDRLTGG